MGFFSKLFERRSQTITNRPLIFTAGSGGGVSLPLVTANTALKNSDIYAVVNRIASDVAACPLVTANSMQQQMLDRPNDLVSRYNFWQQVVAQLLIQGNAVVTMQDNQLELIPYSNVVMTLLDNAKDITYRVSYNDGRPPLLFSSKEVLHFKLMSSGEIDCQYVGVSPLESLVEDVGLQDLSKRLTKKVLENGIMPRYVLKTTASLLDRELKNKVRADFEKTNIGDNANRAIVLDQGLTLDTINISQDVSKYLSNYNFSQNQIAKAFGVPANYLNGTGDEQSSVEMLRRDRKSVV